MKIGEIEKQFRELPMEARRLTGPLFWMHGDANETKERLEMYLGKVAEGGNGCFTAESRPHSDWLGPKWYRDLAICLAAAKKLDLKMWIFDERWWPSQTIDGKVPPRYSAKRLEGSGVDVEGPRAFTADGHGGERYIATVAGRLTADGAIEGDSLVDLKRYVRNGALRWRVPDGKWKVMKFTHKQAPRLRQGKRLCVDGASRDCVDWFIKTVYQPHYDHFKADFGGAISGFFYDEPETPGDWGTELDGVLAEWKVDWKKAYVAYKFRLAGEDHTAARYQYMDALAETWGRTMYGGMSKWCRERGVISMGHFMEHGYLYVNREYCAGDMMRLQKYSDMGGIDLVCRQMYPGKRPHSIYQTPKLASSISHVYNKADDLAMCEIFGGYNQVVTYPQMKWLTDQHQVRGVNFMIPHSFNPKAPRDRDYPPYFYNDGHEPRWPLYRVYADYTSRLSLMLSGGRHVCPVALLFGGNTRHVGKAVTPEDMTSALQDALFDCDWMPFEVFERDASLERKEIKLHEERYRVLIVPPAEVIPYATLAKARDFFEAGGIVLGYGFLPSKSATIGRTSGDITALRNAIWGDAAGPGTSVCRRSAAGGRSYLLPQKPTPEQVQQALTADAGVHPALEVVRGETSNWLHILHRVKAGRDVFLVCNQDHRGAARDFRFRIAAEGVPECWDAMRNEITAVPHRRTGKSVEVDLTLEPLESVLLVFRQNKRSLPARLTADAKPVREPVPVVRVTKPSTDEVGETEPASGPPLAGCSWVWYPEGNPAASAPPGSRYFRKTVSLPAGRTVKRATFHATADNDFLLYVNGERAGASGGGTDNWRSLKKIDVSKRLRAGGNLLAVRRINASNEASPAGLIGCLIVEFRQGAAVRVRIDRSWKAANREHRGWEEPGFDDTEWAQTKEVVSFGGGPWGQLGAGGGGRRASSPVTADPFVGRCEIPAGIDVTRSRVCLEMDALSPEEAARVTVNGAYAGGFIGRPFRLDITKHLKAGPNTVEIAPFAPSSARLAVYAR